MGPYPHWRLEKGKVKIGRGKVKVSRCGVTLVEFAGCSPCRVPGKAVHRKMSHQRHPATEQLRLLLEKLHVPQEAGAVEAILVAGMGPREALPAAARRTP